MAPRWGLGLQEGKASFYKDAASTGLHSRPAAQACISGSSLQICRTLAANGERRFNRLSQRRNQEACF